MPRRFTTEKQVFNYLKKHVEGADGAHTTGQAPVHWERIENRVSSYGTDCFAISGGRVRWIETKIGFLGKRGPKKGLIWCEKKMLKAEQASWMQNMINHGAKCYVVIGVEDKVWEFDFSTELWEALGRGITPERAFYLHTHISFGY